MDWRIRKNNAKFLGEARGEDVRVKSTGQGEEGPKIPRCSSWIVKQRGDRVGGSSSLCRTQNTVADTSSGCGDHMGRRMRVREERVLKSEDMVIR